MSVKRYKIFLLVIFLFVKLDIVNASVSASISVSTTSTVVGNSGKATLTINGNGEHIGQIYGTFSCEGLGNKDLTFTVSDSDSAPTTRSYIIDWVAKSVGTYTCSVSGVQVGVLEHPEDGLKSVSAGSKKISVIGSSGNNSNSGSSGNSGNHQSSGGTTADKKEYDSNNDLKSLVIEGYELNPSFKKDTLEYKLDVDESVEKLNVKASASSDKATVTGIGEVNLTPGENTIQVKVEAENGNEKVYKIVVSVKDQHPIKVTIDGKEYTVVKKNNDIIKKLEYYDVKVIKIDDQDVVSYVNPKTKVRLVILKDSDNQVGFYIYNDQSKKYSKYREITAGGVTLQLLNAPSNLQYFKKYQININDEVVDIYKVKKSHHVGLIYGTNVKNGNTGYYVFDNDEDTLSRYYDEEVKVINSKFLDFKNQAMIFMGVVSGIVIVGIAVSICKAIKRKRRKKRFFTNEWELK